MSSLTHRLCALFKNRRESARGRRPHAGEARRMTQVAAAFCPIRLLGEPAEVSQVEWVARRAGWLPAPDAAWFVVCSQEPEQRRFLWQSALATGGRPARLIDPSAVLADDVEMGEGCLVMPGVVINAAGRLGMNCRIGAGATLDHDVRLGEHVVVGTGCHAAGTVRLDSGCQLGLGVMLIPGRVVGAGACVCSASTVTRDVPPGERVSGTPAREERGPFW